jgi:hypothetical protein
MEMIEMYSVDFVSKRVEKEMKLSNILTENSTKGGSYI